MKDTPFTLQSARPLAKDVWELVLGGDTAEITAPGQFVNIALPGKFLRRPISVCDWEPGRLVLLVKEAGAGTADLVRMAPGTVLDLLTGLGNGFTTDPEAAGPAPVLVGGGIGIAPLYGLAKRLIAAGQRPSAVLGFRTREEAFYLKEFAALGLPLETATEDGSLGVKGFVTQALDKLPEDGYILACGPAAMLKAVHGHPRVRDGQFSFEARMACGFGACVGCSISTVNGPRRVCKDGPVFPGEVITWTCV